MSDTASITCIGCDGTGHSPWETHKDTDEPLEPTFTEACDLCGGSGKIYALEGTE